MPFSRMDPSCTIGFYAKGQKEFESLFTVVNEVCDWVFWVCIHVTFGLLKCCCVAFVLYNKISFLPGVNLFCCRRCWKLMSFKKMA